MTQDGFCRLSFHATSVRCSSRARSGWPGSCCWGSSWTGSRRCRQGCGSWPGHDPRGQARTRRGGARPSRCQRRSSGWSASLPVVDTGEPGRPSAREGTSARASARHPTSRWAPPTDQPGHERAPGLNRVLPPGGSPAGGIAARPYPDPTADPLDPTAGPLAGGPLRGLTGRAQAVQERHSWSAAGPYQSLARRCGHGGGRAAPRSRGGGPRTWPGTPPAMLRPAARGWWRRTTSPGDSPRPARYSSWFTASSRVWHACRPTKSLAMSATTPTAPSPAVVGASNAPLVHCSSENGLGESTRRGGVLAKYCACNKM